jgi:hypothetical protein
MSVHRPSVVLLRVACVACLTHSHAFADPAGEPSPALTAAESRQVVEQVASLVEAHYVDREMRPRLASALREGLAANRYGTSTAHELAARVTSDLDAVAHDKHLSLSFNPGTFEAIRGIDPAADTSPWSPERTRARNSGIEELRILAGNVRYARVTNFMWLDDLTPSAAADAARFLSGGRAVIIDLRGNGGGDPRSVQHLVSPFVGDERLLMTFDDGLSGKRNETRAIRGASDRSLKGLPLFVLTDGGTASAAEEFAYHVAQFGLGMLVGATTAGAANNNTLFPVGRGFVASVSTGRPTHPVSRTNWEGVGVRPAVDCAPERALETAQVLALERVLATAAGDDRGELEWRLAGLRARATPAAVSEDMLREYAGRYGIRSVRLTGGQLVYQRDGGPAHVLRPMGADLFAFPDTDDVRVRFRREAGRVVGFDQVTVDGQVVPSERTGDAG